MAKGKTLVTVIILHRAAMAEHFVGVIPGELTDEQKREFARRFELNPDEEEKDVMYFKVLPLTDISQLKDLPNICGNSPGDSALDADDTLTPEEKIAAEIHDS